MKFLSLFLAPTLALCGTYSGTVTLLDGTPVAGATIKAGTDSVTTSTNGAWSLARSAGISSHSSMTTPVTSHLTIENGRPRISFGSVDISGRSHASGFPVNAMGRVEGSRTTATRSSADCDTLRIYWKSKRLTVLPVPSDTGSLVIKIDTAWKDDAGIPWNPYITYGSLLDTRDNQTYRTVTIGMQTWMAENLNYISSTHSVMYYNDSDDLGAKYGCLYTWDKVMNGEDSSSLIPSGVQGICPTGWHVPSDTEWHILITSQMDSATANTKLKSTGGWEPTYCNGTDAYGFRVLPAGLCNRFSLNGCFNLGVNANFWSASHATTVNSRWYWLFFAGPAVVGHISNVQTNYFSLRCAKE